MFRNLKLQWKILLALILLSVVPLAVSLFIVSQQTEQLIDRNLEQRVEETAQFVRGRIADSTRETGNYLRMLSHDEDLINSILYAENPGEMLELGTALEDAIEVFNLDLVQVMTAEGNILRRHADERFADLPPTSGAELPILQDAIERGNVANLETFDGHLAITAISPIQFHRKDLAYLVGVVFLDDRFAAHIKDLSGADAAFYTYTGEISASAPALKELSVEDFAERETWRADYGGTPYSIYNIGFHDHHDHTEGMLIAFDRSATMAARQNMQHLVLGTLFGVGILAILVGIAISRGIVRPLSEVVANLREIAEGEADLTQQLQVRSRDEIGSLAANFNRFIGRLRETVGRIQAVRVALAGAEEKIRVSSQAVGDGTQKQSASLEESHEAIRGIDQTVAGIAENLSSLLLAAEESSAATLEVGSTTEEIAHQMEKMFENVEEVISSLNEMNTSSREIANNITELSSSAQETAASVIEFDAAIKEIEQNASRTNTFSEEAAQEAERGKEAVDEVVGGINNLCETVDHATAVIQELGKQSNAIGRILTVIDEVADQTGLLALNAAIIAAQAGEHGRGFAVVADEIGDLAERTAVSTREIADIISTLQKGTHEAVEAMTSGSEKVREEVERANIAGEVLEKIRTGTLQSAEEVRGIVRATQEQAHGSQQITRAINQNSDMLMQIAAAIKQHSEGIKHLDATSESMREIAGRVKVSTNEQTVGSRHISKNMEKIRGMIENINEATQEQSRRSHQVVEAVSHVREIAESNVVRTEELDQVVDELTEHAETLKEEMGEFKV